jgi:putative glutamine amidotransferase
MKIGIIPSIKKFYKNQFEYNCDINLLQFFKKNFKNFNIEILTFDKKIDSTFKLIVISGGNDLITFSKEKKNIIRANLNNRFYNISIKKKIPILGICYGAQFIASKFKSKIIKKKHIGKHSIVFTNNKKINVNSYHNRTIKNLGNKLKCLALANDKSVEYFSHKNKKIIGIMWHPERNKPFKKTDKDIVSKLLWN